jgi:chemotaxis protein methyltransferase CheR
MVREAIASLLKRTMGLDSGAIGSFSIDRAVNDRRLACNMTDTEAYLKYVLVCATELTELIEAVVVPETWFFRHHEALSEVARVAYEEWLPAHTTGVLRILSLPCSTGEEPYSIAMWLLENWPSVDDYLIEIVGSDIDTRVLELAREGTFDKRALMRLPPELIGKYFEALPAERWQIAAQLRDSVSFTSVNLVEPDETRRHGQFDFIFCRNVLIYFDDASRRVAAENLYDNLLPGGFICLGHTESMSRISPLFDVRRFADAIVYQRPGITSS